MDYPKMIYRGGLLSPDPANHRTVHNEDEELAAAEQGFGRWDGISKPGDAPSVAPAPATPASSIAAANATAAADQAAFDAAAATATEQADDAGEASIDDTVTAGAAVKRGPGRPRKQQAQ